jgi:hypothetical protein
VSVDSAKTVRMSVVPRLALSPDEAAIALGCSRDFFDDHVRPELKLIRRGRRVFVAITELERWLERSGALTLGGPR